MRTEVRVEKADSPFSYGDKVVFMGSCFSEHIGERLKERKFDIELNPFGVLYNPVSIASGIHKLINPHEYVDEDLFYHQGWWHSFDHHSDFSNADKKKCLHDINDRLKSAAESLKNADYLFVTFGTAQVFLQKSDGKVVSNCHQVPASLFDNLLLRVGDIVRMYTLLIQEIASINNKLKWVFTVSPVRHWKNGPHGNQVSKSTLLLAVNELNDKFDQVGYFPAYEIFMDDLRDYRYYADDMLHPGSQGIDYTWKKFFDAYVSNSSLRSFKAIESFIRAKNHRPRNQGSDEHKKFLEKQYKSVSKFAEQHTEIDLQEFIDFFSFD